MDNLLMHIRGEGWGWVLLTRFKRWERWDKELFFKLSFRGQEAHCWSSNHPLASFVSESISGNDFRAFFLILFRDWHGQIDNCFWHYMGHTLRDRLITAAHHSEGMTRERKQFQKQETRAGETGSRDGPSFSRTLWGELRICTQQKYKHTTFFYSHVSLVEVKDFQVLFHAQKSIISHRFWAHNNSMINAQVCFGMVTIRGHSKTCSFVTQHSATDVTMFDGACSWHAGCRSVHQSCCCGSSVHFTTMWVLSNVEKTTSQTTFTITHYFTCIKTS